MEDKRMEFYVVFANHIKRKGGTELVNWLEKSTDFFTAPASTKYHGAYPGGLLEHSLNVYHRLRELTIRDKTDTDKRSTYNLEPCDEETIAILALLHDVCKTNCYHMETRRRRNQDSGQWEDYQSYIFRDDFPLGHGEKSLYQIARYMDLNPCEALAIRWHMGAYDSAAKSDSRPMSAAMELSPWVWRLQEADMCAAWIDERDGGNGNAKHTN